MAGDVTLNQVSSAKHTTSVLLEMFFFFGYLHFWSKILLQYIFSK